MHAPDEMFDSVRRILGDARGEPLAVTIDEICRRAGSMRRERLSGAWVPDRRPIEAILEQRLGDFPWPLVAGSRGYYIPIHADEINRYLDSLQGRAIAVFRRKRTVLQKALASRRWVRDGRRFTDPPAAQLTLHLSGEDEAHA